MDFFAFAASNARQEFTGATNMKAATRETHYMVGGQWQECSPVSPDAARRPNFLICCKYGDWSGFRTLADCLAQTLAQREDFFYWIEER